MALKCVARRVLHPIRHAAQMMDAFQVQLYFGEDGCVILDESRSIKRCQLISSSYNSLKDFPEWEFLPKDDLNRKTLEIFFDLKLAKRSCNKEQKVLKVPNTDVFRIVSPILISRGISRIVSDEKLIAL